jgi:predicted negative regulator of RcsB-dependent stress response
VPTYTRRQLKEDKFAETAQDAMSWAAEHRSKLTWTVVVLLVVAGLIFGLLMWNSRQTEHANIALSKALQTYSAPLRAPEAPPDPNGPSFTSMAERGKQAEKEFKAIADQYPHTKPGKIARYLAGAAALQAGDNATAEQLLKSASEDRDHNIAALAKLGLASLYRSTNRPGDAAKIYKDLSDHPTDTVSKSEAQLQLAEMYEATDPKEAATIYQQIQKDDPNSEAANLARSKSSNAPK